MSSAAHPLFGTVIDFFFLLCYTLRENEREIREMKSTIFFDLDGTLVESGAGIKAGFAYAMEALGKPMPAEEVSDAVVGPPIYTSLYSLYGFSDADARRGVSLYREFYNETGIYMNSVYEGVHEMLTALSATGTRLVLATGKPRAYAVRICAHMGLRIEEGLIFGSEFDGTRGDKADLLLYAAEKLGCPLADSVMVGDRCYDIAAALRVGAVPFGVLWGYGTRDELVGAGAQYLAKTPAEATALLKEM